MRVRPGILLIALIVLVCGGAALVFDVRSVLSLTTLRRLVESAGPFGPIAFMAIMIGGLFIPGPEFLWVVLGGLVFEPVPAFFYALTAAILGTSLQFFIVRRSVGDFSERGWNTRFERLRVLDEPLVRHGVFTVALLRLVLFLNPFVNWALGATRVRPWASVVGTGLGLAPGIGITVVFAEMLAEADSYADLLSPRVLTIAAVTGLFSLLAIFVGRRILRRQAHTKPATIDAPELAESD